MSTPDGTDPFGRPYRPPPRGLDTIGWFIAISHQLLGHDFASYPFAQAAAELEAGRLCPAFSRWACVARHFGTPQRGACQRILITCVTSARGP